MGICIWKMCISTTTDRILVFNRKTGINYLVKTEEK